MPYTRSWNDATPAGTRAANQIDDAIREFKVDLHERMDSTFSEDWTADPVVAKAAVSGKVTGKYLLFGPHIMTNRQDEHDTTHQELYFQFDGTEAAQGNLIFPIGITIVEFAILVDKISGVNMTVEFYRSSFTTGTKTSIHTFTHSAVGISQSTSPALAEVTDLDRMYMIRAVGNGCRFYGARAKYNTPSSVAVI
jgi:hypothetical protein